MGQWQESHPCEIIQVKIEENENISAGGEGKYEVHS